MMSDKLPIVLSSETVFSGFVALKREMLQLPSHPPHPHYTLVASPAAVMVIATTKEGKWVLNHEYRHSAGRVLLSTPGGTLEANEDPLDGARRELLEETGYIADSYHLIGQSYPFPGICGQITYFVAAIGAHQTTSPQREAEEIIDTDEYAPEELTQALKDGAAIDGLLCTALFWHQQAK